MSGAGDFCQCVAGDAKRHGVWLPDAAFYISFALPVSRLQKRQRTAALLGASRSSLPPHIDGNQLRWQPFWLFRNRGADVTGFAFQNELFVLIDDPIGKI